MGYVCQSALVRLSAGQHEIITGKPEKNSDNPRQWDVIPLYAAPQPALVVQDDSDPRDVFEATFPMPKHVQRCGSGYTVTSYGAWVANDYIVKWEGWNACRAAMLQVNSGGDDGPTDDERVRYLAWDGVKVVSRYRHAQPAPEVPEDVRQALSQMDDEIIAELDAEESARRAAMLQDETVTTANKLPKTEFKQVADLYEMQFDDGRPCAFHTDAETAVQWLNACDGNKVQEYVKLERLQEAVSGNSPVIHKVDDNEAIS